MPAKDVKRLIAAQDNPYWGLRIALARRMAGGFTLIGTLLTVILWPFSPPTDQFGAGWLVAVGIAAFGLGIAASIFVRPSLWSYRAMAGIAYAGVIAVSLMQWLSGGAGGPYENLLLIPMLFVSAIYTPRVIVAFFVAVAASYIAPLAYDQVNGDLAANAVGSLLLLAGVSAAVHYLMIQVRTQQLELAHDEQHARAQARVDDLTQVGNRRAFQEALEDEISRAARMGTPLSVAMGDIESFKLINDQFGHLEGDGCLRRVADAIASELRAPDRVFRWGGDEFALLLPGASKQGAEKLAQRLREKVAAACRRPDNEAISVRWGAAELRSPMTPLELVAAADLALMASRAAGKELPRPEGAAS